MSDLFEPTADRSLTAKRDEATAASDARDWPRAAALWDELRAAQPQDPHWWFKAGEAYSEGRVLDRAEDILGEAVAQFPDHCWIAYRYAVLARYAGDFGEGLGRIEKHGTPPRIFGRLGSSMPKLSRGSAIATRPKQSAGKRPSASRTSIGRIMRSPSWRPSAATREARCASS